MLSPTHSVYCQDTLFPDMDKGYEGQTHIPSQPLFNKRHDKDVTAMRGEATRLEEYVAEEDVVDEGVIHVRGL